MKQMASGKSEKKLNPQDEPSEVYAQILCIVLVMASPKKANRTGSEAERRAKSAVGEEGWAREGKALLEAAIKLRKRFSLERSK